MFLLRGTTDDDRTRTCTGTAAQAIRHHNRMTREGLSPVVTDQCGRRLTLYDLERRAQAVRAAPL